MFDRFSGVKDQATGEGTHFMIPWLQRAILFDVRIKPRVSVMNTRVDRMVGMRKGTGTGNNISRVGDWMGDAADRVADRSQVGPVPSAT